MTSECSVATPSTLPRAIRQTLEYYIVQRKLAMRMGINNLFSWEKNDVMILSNITDKKGLRWGSSFHWV